VSKFKFLVAALTIVVLASACSSGSAFDASSKPTTTTGDPEISDDGNVDLDPQIDEPIRPEDPADVQPVAESADSVMVAAAIDVGAFWAKTYPELYGSPLPELTGGLWSYSPDTPQADLPPCGGAVSYNDIAQNAFYCPADDLIAWDRDGLVGPFIDKFGAFTAALVMAHEYGHAIQTRSGDSAMDSVYTELQADCFAGAWVAYVADGNSDVFEADLSEIDAALGGLITIRDVPGSSPDDPSAHGSGFDRVSAFSDGLFDGATRCADYRDVKPVITQQVFTAEDEVTGGNLSPDELLPLLYTDLEDFFTQEFTKLGKTWVPVNEPQFFDPDTDDVTCGGDSVDESVLKYGAFYCVPDNLPLLDGAYLLPDAVDIGDFAVAVQIARQWAYAAQVQLGNTDDNKGTSLHADCLTGLYAGDVFFQLRGDAAQLQLSAGDLDEAIISFLAFGKNTDESVSGTPFERTDAFRTGFLNEFSSCDAYLQQG
jgi:predicted metalloprotease